ncbi:SDR family NAD(P)-dependent oxidoreductase [Actinoplanes sp. N902-109]|uniref:SDR family NAD(P)-dependent oxidoreductase n=1 Tax=Actinoplanes sp. (strain N902-109) TaxID=649831 RepID=UPI00032942E6|nr:SDR family NAD(P)-dependent oxidoreductase [Actinoplanes sp. N902-109]AGL15820.1 short-chain dehydrogenase/reductase SDR [Actinoplanes sp. N902-109]
MTTRTWLITGASRGLGRAIATAVLANGDNLVATARRPAHLPFDGPQVRTVALDVTDPAAARAAVDVAVKEFGRLDVVVNNAGYADSAPVEEMPDDVFRAQIEANLFGVVNVTRAALPVLRAQRSGLLLQISSVGGRVGGSAGIAAYQAAKFGVEGFSLALAKEVEPLGIRTVIVEPGSFRTDWGGASMDIAASGPDYRESVGFMHRYRAEAVGKEPGDPARAARLLVQLPDLPELPQRLLLGSDAARITEAAEQAWLTETRTWAPVSAATDFTSDADLDITKLLAA